MKVNLTEFKLQKFTEATDNVNRDINETRPFRCLINDTAQNMKFFIKDFFSKCDQVYSFLPDLVTFTEKILHGKLYILCSGRKRKGA